LLGFVSVGAVQAHDEPFVDCDVFVIDVRGRPVEGAQVWVFRDLDYGGGGPDFEKVFETFTDFRGHIHFQEPAVDSGYFVIAYRPGLSPGWSMVQSWDPRQRVYLQLGDAESLDGIVVDEKGGSLANVPVYARLSHALSEDYGGCFETISGEDGSFLLNHLPEGTFIVSTAGRYRNQTRWPSFGTMVRTCKDRRGLVTVKVETGIPVEFVLIEPQTKRLIPNVSVEAAFLRKRGAPFFVGFPGKQAETDGLPCLVFRSPVMSVPGRMRISG
jgi:hypothetical protein